MLGCFFLFDEEYHQLNRAIYTGVAFVENFHLLRGVGYFEAASKFNPLTHLWSLSVEEQFYIAFPLLAMGAVALGRRLEWVKANARCLGLVAIVLITLGSFALCLGTESTKHAFYWPWTRFWEISAGIVLAYAEIYYGFQLNRGIRQGLTWLGLAMVLWAFWGYDATIRTPGLFSLFAVLGAVFLIAAKPDAWVNRTLLSWKPVTFIGLISYSLYLWHWPLLSFSTIVWGEEPMPLILGGALVVSALIATIVFFTVERPLRYVSTEKSNKVVSGLLVGLVVTAIVSQAIDKTKGSAVVGVKLPPELETGLILKEVDKLPLCEMEGVSFQCTLPGKPPSMLVLGDSHAQQYVNKLQAISATTGKNIALIADGSYWSLENESPRKRNQTVCRKSGRSVMALSSVQVVLYIQKWGHEHYDESMLLGVGKEVSRLIKKYPDKRFILMEDNPWDATYNWRDHVNRWTLLSSVDDIEPACWTPSIKGQWNIANEIVRKRLPKKAEWLPMVQQLCPDLVCETLPYQDDNHLSPYYLRDHATWLDEVEAYLKSLS